MSIDRRNFLKLAALMPLGLQGGRQSSERFNRSLQISLPEFCEEYFPRWFTQPFTPRQLRDLQWDEMVIDPADSMRCIVHARQHASGVTTTLLAEMLFALLGSHRRYAVFLTASYDAAETLRRLLCTELIDNESLRAAYPELNCIVADRACNRALWNQGLLPGGGFFQFHPVICSLKGMKKGRIDGRTIRPDLVIVDHPFSAAAGSSVARRRFIDEQIRRAYDLGCRLPCSVIEVRQYDR